MAVEKATSQKPTMQCISSLSTELTQLHLYHILFIQASHESQLDPVKKDPAQGVNSEKPDSLGIYYKCQTLNHIPVLKEFTVQ